MPVVAPSSDGRNRPLNLHFVLYSAAVLGRELSDWRIAYRELDFLRPFRRYH